MNLVVMFIDDEINLLNGLKRMMYPMRNEWDIVYANGGKEAQEILNQKDIDVVVSDIRMPGISGTQLLQFIKDNFPNIIRITLSGYANDNIALQNTRIVHQSLSKPTTPEKIKSTIEKAVNLRNRLRDNKLLSLVNNIEVLPSLPEIYLELEEEIKAENSSIEKISSIIKKDPLITVKILQLTNSAFFGLSNRISDIKQAVNILGINVIKNLVLSIKLFKITDSTLTQKKFFESIWHHSNHVARIASQISKMLKLNRSVTEDCYLAGLLHDIGKIIILENSDKIILNNKDELIDNKINNPIHADIGAYLLGLWGIPDLIVQSVLEHHNELSLEKEFEDYNVSDIIRIANYLAKMKSSSEEITIEVLNKIIDKQKITA